MTPPKQRKDHASSREILRLAARRLVSATASSSTGEGARDIVRTEQVVKKIWHSVALVISDSLLSFARGVRLESLGTFTLDAKGRPKFFLAHAFAARHRLLRYNACAGGCLAGGSVNTRLNATRVAATAGRPRPETESVIDAVLCSLHQRLNKGKSVTLSFHPVAEFMCVPGDHARLRYLSVFEAKQEKAGTAATHARVGVARAKPYSIPWAAAPSFVGAAAEGRVSRISASIAGDGVIRSTKRNKLRRPLTAALGHRSKPDHKTEGRPGSSHSDGGAARSVHGATVNNVRESDVTKDPVGTRRQAWVSPRSSAGQHSSDASRCLKPAPASPDGLPTAQYTSSHHSSIGSLLERDRDDLDSAVKKRNPTDARDHNGNRTREDPSVVHSTGSGEMWLADLLRRKTRSQAGEEGFRRLVETLKLMLVSGSGNSVRISGQDFILILRDVGTKLTSAELARITSLLTRRPDGRLSVRALAKAIGTSFRQRFTSAAESRMCTTAGEMCRSLRRQSALSQDRAARVTSSSRGSSTLSNVDYLACRGVEPTSPCTEISLQSGEASHEWAGSGQCPSREMGDSDDDCASVAPSRRASSDTKVNGVASTRPTFGKARIHPRSGSPLSSTPRECWRDGVGGDGGMRVKAAAEREAIAELAKIVYNPPCSLERLIHILQASKIAEHPTIAWAAMSSRLLQLRPRLGKARAKELAAAACHYPDLQIDLGKLHSLLARRFGRSNSSFASSGTTQRGNFASSLVASEAAAKASDARISCAAIDRVRRNLLSGGGTFAGLGVALSSASGCGDGTLTKDELRRALSTASGREQVPPTAKDVDDLFTLFSCGTSAGVGGDKVEALTVLRGLRGELSPCRERVVRDIFRALLRLSDGGEVGRGIIMNGDRGTDPGERVIPVDHLQQAACGGEPSDNTTRLILSGVDKGNRGRMGATTKGGASVEEFLEYYRDLSTCIDGDDAFEAIVRGSWSLGVPGQVRQESASRRGNRAVEPAPPTGSPPIATVERTGAPVKDPSDTAETCRRTNAATGAALPTTSEPSQDRDSIDRGGSFDASRVPLASTKEMAKSWTGLTTAAAVKTIQPASTTSTRAKQSRDADERATLKGIRDNEKTIFGVGDTASGSRLKKSTRVTRGTRAKATSAVEYTRDSRSSAEPTRHHRNVNQGRNTLSSADDHVRPLSAAAATCRDRRRDQPHIEWSSLNTSERRLGNFSRPHERCFAAASRSARGQEGGEGSHRVMARRAGAADFSGRGAAALCVQRMFRGHKGRRSAAAESRKLKRRKSDELEERAMRERPAAESWQLGARLPRTKMPGTYGF